MCTCLNHYLVTMKRIDILLHDDLNTAVLDINLLDIETLINGLEELLDEWTVMSEAVAYNAIRNPVMSLEFEQIIYLKNLGFSWSEIANLKLHMWSFKNDIMEKEERE